MVVLFWAPPVWGNSAPLPVTFEPSGQSLPQAGIRVAIGTELGREARGEEPEEGERDEKRERVVVAVDELGQLWLRYWGPRGLVDRHLAMPANPEQIPLVVSLSVGNLVRQEAFELLRDLEQRRARDAKPAEAPPPPSRRPPHVESASSRTAARTPPPLPRRSPPPAPARPRPKNTWGHYLAGDFAYVPTISDVCSAGSGTRCYDRDFAPVTLDTAGTGIAGGVVAAHGRYLMAYSRELTPGLWVGIRVGFAFSGGKAKAAAAEQDPATSAFLPWLLELRVQRLLGEGAFGGGLRPYVHAAGGLAEVSAEVAVQAPFTQDGATEGDARRLTAIRAMGLLFAGAGVGASVSLFDNLRAEPEISGFFAFPSYGWFLRPSIGLSYDF